MKKITKYLLQIAAAMMLCSAMASCRQDILFEDEEGTLPPGSHPLSFVASVGSMKSRSEGKNSWKKGDMIGVRTISLKGRKYSMLGCYSLNEEGMMMDVVKRYTVGQDNSWNELDDEPLEWPYPQGRVSAWYPFEPQIDVPMDNQAEKGFDHLDFLSVTTGEQSYKEVVDLEFKHQMAKVTCHVMPGDGITPDEFETLWLKFQGHTSCTFRETELTGGKIGWITPDSTYNYADGSLYEALLVPNEMSEKDLISIGLKTNYEGNTIPKFFTYPSPKIEAGKHYIYNITVKKDRIEVSFFTVEWDDVSEGQHEPTRFTFRVNLTEGMVNMINVFDPIKKVNVINTNLVEFSDNVTPIFNTDKGLYDKFDVEGNDFTLIIGANRDTRSKNLVIIENEAVNNPRLVYQTGPGNSECYVENNIFLITDETTLGYEDKINVGDYFFSDGSWSSILEWKGVSCVGIVFAVNNNEDLSVFKLTDGGYDADYADNYNFTNAQGVVNPIFASQRIRGYVIALKDAERQDYVTVTKTLNNDAEYQAGTLEFDTEVVVTKNTLNYSNSTTYPAGTLPYDLMVVAGTDTTYYKKGTVYPAGKLSRSIKVEVLPDTTIYAKGTSYVGGKLITSLKISYLNVPKLVESFPWSPLDGASAFIGAVCSFETDLFDGYANMVSVKRNEGNPLGTTPVPPFNELEAFAAAEAFETFFKAPEGTSGWYLPSIKQLQTALDYFHQYDNNNLESPIKKAAGIIPYGVYWSSTIGYRSGTTAPGFNAYTYDYNKPADPLSTSQITSSNTKYVRAVLTF